MKRLLLGHAEECTLDASGRILLPAPLREFANLEKRVVLVGQGNKFEIWNETGLERLARGAAEGRGRRRIPARTGCAGVLAMADSAALPHRPVLLAETLAGLNPRPAGRYLDATFGRGGHAAAILAALGPEGRLLALDRDPAAEHWAQSRFGGDSRFTFARSAFGRLEQVVAAQGLTGRLDGVLFDLGPPRPSSTIRRADSALAGTGRWTCG